SATSFWVTLRPLLTCVIGWLLEPCVNSITQWRMPPRNSFKLFLVTVFSAYTLVMEALALTPMEQAHLPKVTRQDIAHYRAEHEADWLSRIEVGKQRLFYTAAEWEAEAARIMSMEGRGASMRRLLFKEAN